jgi:thioredoxin-related protein
MKKYLLLFVFTIVGLTATAQEKINWLSFEEATALAEIEKKPMLVSLYATWCGWCKKMDRDTFSNKIIINFLNEHFYAIKFDGESKKDIEYKGDTYKYQKNGRRGYHQLAASLLNGKLSYPANVFLNKEGEVIQNVPGYHKKERFEVILAYFTNENYKTKKWEDFEKNFKSKS